MKQRIKRAVLAAALCAVSSEALAISRYDASTKTCAEVQAIVKREGAVILSYASTNILGLQRYDRYVRDQSACEAGEVYRRAGVPTSDEKYCPVGRCVESKIFVAD